MDRRRGMSRRIAAALEAGLGPFGADPARSSLSAAAVSALSMAAATYGASARLVTPLDWSSPAGRRALVTVGGATLGGDGKTRLAIACVQVLAQHGVRVALVGHAYRARPGRARVVAASDDVSLVGDEALVAARHLGDRPGRPPVVVGPDRQSAVTFAFGLADVVVLDGTLQVAPVPATLALLAQSASAPWGAGVCPPRGDLRASRERLLARADLAVALPDAGCDVHFVPAGEGRVGESTLSLADFAASHRHLRLGLFTALARPERIVRLVLGAGVDLVVHREDPDHAPCVAQLRSIGRAYRLDGWLATDKCSSSLTSSSGAVDGARGPGAPLYQLVARQPLLPLALRERLHALARLVSPPAEHCR